MTDSFIYHLNFVYIKMTKSGDLDTGLAELVDSQDSRLARLVDSVYSPVSSTFDEVRLEGSVEDIAAELSSEDRYERYRELWYARVGYIQSCNFAIESHSKLFEEKAPLNELLIIPQEEYPILDKSATLEEQRDQLQMLREAIDYVHKVEFDYFEQCKNVLTSLERDYLTGLYNKRTFEDMLKQTLAFRQRTGDYNLAVLMVDLDNFKRYNDENGHIKGDELLALVGSTIKSAVRESDCAARYGGDEFIILANNPGEGIDRLTERIMSSLQDKGLECSIGVAYLDESVLADEVPYKQMMARADKALYMAKKNGRSRVEYFSR